MKSETVELESGTYTVNEMTMRQVLPLMQGDQNQMSIELVKIAVLNSSGQPVGETVLDLGFQDFQQLLAATNRVHGFTDEEKPD
jgi:hypothetical protein